jgi:hypothetical protein
MAATEHMKASADKMEQAAARLLAAREGAFTPSGLQKWLSALTDYALALGEVQELSQQSIHEKLQQLTRALHRPNMPAARRRSG